MMTHNLSANLARLVSSAEMMGYETEIAFWFLVLEDCIPVVEKQSIGTSQYWQHKVAIFLCSLCALEYCRWADDFLKVFKYHVVTVIFVVRGRSESLATIREK